jgi:diguanylate cyclase (GGDEF)-like protein
VLAADQTIADQRADRAQSAFAFAPATAMNQTRAALGLYAVWIALSMFSVVTGQIDLAQHGATVLLVGVAGTNAMFLMLASSSVLHRPPDRTIVLAQSVMAVTWATLFLFMSSGSAELAFGMYFSIILFASQHVRRSALAQLAIFAVASYIGVAGIKLLLTEPQAPIFPHLIGILAFAGVVGWYLLAGHRSGDVVEGSNTKVRDVAAVEESRRNHQQQILESLEREKGRTDRINYPFSICVFDIDRLKTLIREHGPEVTATILQSLEERVRGELRAMDGINNGGNRRRPDLFDDEPFIVIMPQTNLAGAARCATRICATAERFPIDGQYVITVSAGVVEYRRGESVTDLLERAHSELGAAEANGGNRVAGYTETNEKRADVISLRGGSL